MTSKSRTNAENRFAAIEKTQPKPLSAREEEALKLSEKNARLKALRLARDATGTTASPTKKIVS